MRNLITTLKRLLTIANTFDPDNLRRRQILNHVLLFMIIVDIFQLSVTFRDKEILILAIQGKAVPDFSWIFVSSCIVLVLSSALLVLNRSPRMPRDLAGWIFVIGMLALVSVADSPLALTEGRSIFMWAIPVTLSVVVLPPVSVFLVDLLISVAFVYYSDFSWQFFQIYTLLEIYIVSFISWFGMTIAERAIRDARNESKTNRAILDGVADGVVVVRVDNKVSLTNPVAEELMGGEVNKILSAAESAEINGRILSFRWNSVQGVGRVAIIRDISRQVEVDRAKDAILRVVSHEMRTPLAAILGFAEILESRPVPGLATRIRVNAQRMLKLVNDLLDVAQLQAGVLSVHKDNFAPAILASHVTENFSKLADEKGIVLEVNLSPALPEQVSGDVQRLEQVLANLVGNAIKFTEEGGRVDVWFCTGDQTNWQIVVKDTGTGIPPERLSDVFEPFRRASDYAKRKHQGVGLGLAIVKRIVQLSGGDISVESIVGKGSAFTVTLPKT